MGIVPTDLNASPPTVGALPRKYTFVSLVELRNAEYRMFVTPAGIVIEVRALAPNALFPMYVTLAGMLMEESAVAFSKTKSPIAVSKLPGLKVTVASEVAPENAPSPMKVTLAGILIDGSALAQLNAYSPIDVTPAGIVIEVSELAFWNEEFPMAVSKLPGSKVTLVSDVVPKNAPLPMIVALVGIVTEVIRLAKANAPPPIDVTPLGTTTDPTHPLLAVTTLSVIVKSPPPAQGTVVTTAARAGLEIKAISKAEIVTKGRMSLRIWVSLSGAIGHLERPQSCRAKVD